MEVGLINPLAHIRTGAVKGGMSGDYGDQLPVIGLGYEITAAGLDQLLLQPVFPLPVRALSHSVLVGDAPVVAGGQPRRGGRRAHGSGWCIPRLAGVTVAEAGTQSLRCGAPLAPHRKD